MSIDNTKIEIKGHSFSLGIFFLSMSILLFELVLVRLFSIVYTNNVKFLAISITLFGVALGGIIVHIYKNYFISDNYQSKIIRFGIYFAVSLFIFPVIFITLPFGFSLLPVLIGIALSAVPFMLGNIIIVTLFTVKSKEINNLYFFDLMGAGIGVILAVVLMQFLDGPNLIFIASFLAFTSVVFLSRGQKKVYKPIVIINALLLLFVVANQYFGIVKIFQTKIGTEDNVIFTKWNSFSRITVDLPEVWERDPKNAPLSQALRIDSSALTTVVNYKGNDSEVEYLKKDIASIPYYIAPRGKTLIIGPGGGRDVLTALLFGNKVKGVEINPIIVNDVVKDFSKEFSGDLYNHKDVEIVVAEGRSYLERDNNKYQILHLPLVDTWATVSSGNLSLLESYLYTVEAFETYLKKLDEKGILSITRWEASGKKLLPLFYEACKRLGIESPKDNIIIVSEYKGHKMQLNNYLFRKEKFTEDEYKNIVEFTKNDEKFSVVYSPFFDEKNFYYDFTEAKDTELFIKNYAGNISSVSDDSPFFFNDVKFRNNKFNIFSNSQVFILAIVSFLSLIIFLLPIIFFPKNSIKNDIKSAVRYIIYFGLLGLSFLLIEIVLIQKFILFLERPEFAYSVVLISLLIFAGLGSMISNIIDSLKNRAYIFITLYIFIVSVIYYFYVDNIISAMISASIAIKIAITVLLILPFAVAMGMLLPLGIKKLSLIDKNYLIPWAWAMNGAMSVFASGLAIILAMTVGFKAVMLIAATAYLISPFFIFSKKKKARAGLL